ncbi:MAG TPA: DEAD/DEAH box helicase, partial [Gemmatimonadaceae bacterium]|nr:DEAD/DEAH box helicase [Gemmatimonadaceae bacterium]
MEQAERVEAPDGATRSQHLVYTLPHTASALASVLAPAVERIDTDEAAVQLLIVTADAESTVMVSDVVSRLAGTNGVVVVPVTSANRAARLIEGRAIHAVVGQPLELQTLVQRSTLKLDSVKTIVLAWADGIVASGPDAVSSMEALFAEFPKEAGRLIVTRQMTGDVEQLIERYARNARRVEPGAEARRDADVDTSQLTFQCVTVTETSRLTALRRLLDDLDPPSAVVVVRAEESESAANHLLRQLGYRLPSDPLRVSAEAVEPSTHTVILFDPPTNRTEAAAGTAEGVVQTVALVTPQEMEALRTLGVNVTPLTLRGASNAARQRDRMLRDELLGVLSAGVALREIMALEPLLEQYDGIEIAAAAARLLEQARVLEKRPAAGATAAAMAPTREERPNREPREDRPFSDRPKRDFTDRPKRDFTDRPKRDFNDRPKRD